MGAQERIGALAFGAPLGSHPLTRDMGVPYTVYVARRAGRFKRLAMACAVALALAMTTFAVSAFAANQPGYWYRTSITGGPSGGSGHTDPSKPGGGDLDPYVVTWEWRAKDGSVPPTVTIGGREQANPITFEGSTPHSAPGTPEGWYQCYRPSTNPYEFEENKKNEQADPDTPEGQNPMWDEVIYGNPPEFELSMAFVSNAITNYAHGAFRNLVVGMSDLADWFLSIIGTNAESLFKEPFNQGTFGQFYEAASRVSDYAFEPYALALLSVTFVVGLVHVTDPRRRLAGTDWLEEVLMLIAMMGVCATLIVHAIDLCAAVYWLAQNLVEGVDQALTQIGMSPEDLGSQTVSGALISHYDALTYAQGGSIFVFLLIALVAVVVCAVCSCMVLTTIFLRAGEIYLRAAASPLCLSLLIDEKTRASGMGYVKRFCAVCFQAAVIFIALALAPLFFDVSAGIVGTVGTSSIPGLSEILTLIIPTLCALFAVTGIVRTSEPIANSIFGLA